MTAHVLDVGGSFPGINADAFDVYAESKLYNGLRWYQRGTLNEDLDRMIFENVRTETMNRGDMNAMLAACQLGCERFLRLVQRYGVDTVMSAGYDWMDYSERMLRAQIEKIPDGEYKAPTGWLDDDARNRGVRLRVETTVRVEGDEITIDRPAPTPRCRPATTCPTRARCSLARTTPRTVLLDEDVFPEHVPQNDGIFRPVKVIAPGTIYNPTFPRACFSRFCQVQRVVDNTILALADALPEQVSGNSAGVHFCSYSGFLEETGEYWIYLEVNEGSYGGRSARTRWTPSTTSWRIPATTPSRSSTSASRFAVTSNELRRSRRRRASGGGISIVRRNRFSGRRHVLARATASTIRRAASSVAGTGSWPAVVRIRTPDARSTSKRR